jgi:hypothetical protein
VRLAFVALGALYAVLLAWGIISSLPHVPTIGVLGMAWCALGWKLVETLELG